MIGIIDLDPVLHIIANVQYAKGNRDREQDVRNHVRSFVNGIKANAKCDSYYMFYQGPGFKNFRKDILPEYKSHRVPSEGILLWKAVVLDEFKQLKATRLHYIESDDACALLAGEFDVDEFLLITGDKDAKQVVGNQYNPYKGGLSHEARFSYIQEDEANEFIYAQILAGDPGDIPGEFAGIPGIGMKTAIKYLRTFQEHRYPHAVTQKYLSKYPKDEARKRFKVTYQMVKLIDKNMITHYGEKVQKECERVLKLKPKEYINQATQLFDDFLDT